MKILARTSYTIGIWIAISTIYGLRIPKGFQSFWAEDGGLFYQDATNHIFPKEFTEPAAGYLVLVARIIARITNLFPLETVPLVNFLQTTLVMTILVLVVFITSETFIIILWLRLLLAASFLFIPIASFESIASSGNLHFFLPVGLVFILISVEKNSKISFFYIFLVALACLSDPLCIFCLPFIFHRKIIRSARQFTFIQSIYSKVFLIALSTQLVFFGFALLHGGRATGQGHSIIKTFYLFLDRVVGSTFVPGWGSVTSGDFINSPLNSKLLIRAIAAILVITFWVILYFKSPKAQPGQNLQVLNQTNVIIKLIGCLVPYWFIAGIGINPEPRYAVFPSFCLLTVGVVVLDRHLMGTVKRQRRIYLLGLFSATLIATWVLSWTPSSLRTTGPEWRNEISKAATRCETLHQQNANLRILPEYSDWFVTVSCDSIIDSKK